MASTDPSNGAAATAPQNVPRSAQSQLEEQPSSTPLEMSSLPSERNTGEAQPGVGSQFATSLQAGKAPARTDDTRTTETAQLSNAAGPSSPTSPTVPSKLTRYQSTAIGPSSDEPISVTKEVEEAGPTLMITLLLINGARHPFKLDQKYLNKRNVEVQGNDPFNLSVYKLKELILREWREGMSSSLECYRLCRG
jgi:hypothetical protein